MLLLDAGGNASEDGMTGSLTLVSPVEVGVEAGSQQEVGSQQVGTGPLLTRPGPRLVLAAWFWVLAGPGWSCALAGSGKLGAAAPGAS